MEKIKVAPITKRIILTSNGFGGFFTKEETGYEPKITPKLSNYIVHN